VTGLAGVTAVGVVGQEVPFHVREHLAKVLRVGPVQRLRVPQAQWLAGLLHEVHQLVDLEEGHEGVHQSDEVTFDEPDQDGSAWSHRRGVGGPDDILEHRGAIGLEEEHPHIGQRGKGLFDARANLGPIEAAQAASERRHRD